MATRIPYNTDIDYEVLEKIRAGEAYLRTMIEEMYACSLHGDIVRIEVDLNAFEKVLR